MRRSVVERLVPGPGVSQAKRADTEMMVFNDSRERAESEYETLLERAGWEHVETWDPEDGDLSVVAARRG